VIVLRRGQVRIIENCRKAAGVAVQRDLAALRQILDQLSFQEWQPLFLAAEFMT
jgi:hypothetical protein